jgi:hypothetical protein
MNDERARRSPHDLAQPEDSGLADRLLREEFARSPADPARAAGVHVPREYAAPGPEGGAAPVPPPRSRSHRAGTLAGLGIVGVLLAVLVVVAPGGSPSPRTAKSMHGVSESSPPASNAASIVTSTAPLPTMPTTPSSASTTTTTTTTTRPAATAATTGATLHCILGPLC